MMSLDMMWQHEPYNPKKFSLMQRVKWNRIEKQLIKMNKQKRRY